MSEAYTQERFERNDGAYAPQPRSGLLGIRGRRQERRNNRNSGRQGRGFGIIAGIRNAFSGSSDHTGGTTKGNSTK